MAAVSAYRSVRDAFSPVSRGLLRPVSQAARRAVEAARLGFKRIFVSSYTHFDKKPDGIEVVKVADIPALVRALFK